MTAPLPEVAAALRRLSMRGRPKLLMVVNDAAFFLSHRAPVARAAREAGLDVHIATPDSAQVAEISREGFHHHCIPLTRSSMAPLENARSLASLISMYRTLHPDIVHHVTIKPVLYGSVAARASGVRRIVNAPTGLGYVFVDDRVSVRLLRGAIRIAYRNLFRGSQTRVLFHNPDDLEAMLQSRLLRREQAILVGGAGVDLQKYRPTPEPVGVPVALLAARLLWQKGVGEFVTAARALLESGLRARFVLAGDTDPNPSSVSKAQLLEWQRAGTIEWVGPCNDMPSLMASSNVVCLPSYREGLPKVLLEAAACGRAIVATDVPGCRHVARHEQNALLVPPRDGVALAAALGRLLVDIDLRARLGTRGREIAVAEFGEERVVAETLAVYYGLLQ